MYIIHYGELALKGKNRDFFEKKLMYNINHKLLRMLGEKAPKVQKKYGKFILDTDDVKVEAVLLSTPGISYFAEAKKTGLNMDEIKKVALEMLPSGFFSFKVVTTRTNKKFEFNSVDVNIQVGGYIMAHTDNKKVELKKPEITVYVNIAEKEAYIYTAKKKGIGGLPIGSAGRVISLLSGGIDSPVSSYLLMKRGCEVIFFHAYNKTLNPEKVKEKVKMLAQKLAQIQGKVYLYFVPYERIQKEIVQGSDSKYRMLLFKRSIVRVANKFAETRGAKAIVLGDSLGQVASQTLENIQCIYDASELPVFSPLLGYDKQEIIQLSQKIGTYDISIQPHDDCCSLIASDNPQTKGRIDVLKKIEDDIMIHIAEEQLLDNIEQFSFENS